MGAVCAKKARAIVPAVVEPDLFGYDLDKAVDAARQRLAVAIDVAAAAAQMAIRREFHLARVRLLGWKERP